MSRTQFEWIESVFFAALEMTTPEERCAFLDRECGSNAELRREVERLLRFQPQVGDFLERPTLGMGAAATELAGGESVGTEVGPYRLVQPIGEGGFGVVFLAEQTHPVQRRVAVKVLRPGMDSSQVIARFEAERQALALMDHPNIARVLDAGKTDRGRPYFVMELVRGVSITQFCDEHRLTPRQRLELFVPVCQAVQHAHQKGIIHRDLKPSNVLIAVYDGKPLPKVIDFGVAKATGSRLTERTLITDFGAVIGTLEYMSPEQAELDQLDVDTRSDIYSLGVILYELLTGTTPLERRRLKGPPLLTLLRLIREEEPPAPSTRLSSTDDLTTIAGRRGLEPRKLPGLVRGELDWIVMKALEKDRDRRYETATALAQDLERYLRDEPVQAGPPSAAYRLRKFARRNQRTLITAGVLGLVLLAAVGAVAGTIGWVVRDREARQARLVPDLHNALARADLFLAEGNRGEARAALARAEVLAAEMVPGDDLRQRQAALQERLAAADQDQDFIIRFEQIRLEAQSQVDAEINRFQNDQGLPLLLELLRQYGIEVARTPPARALARIKERPEAMQAQLLAALQECYVLTPKRDTAAERWLLEVLNTADADPWRVRLRQASNDPAALVQLSRAVDMSRQRPSFLISVARAMPPDAAPARLDLLRRVQRAFPADFWSNHELAQELAGGGQPEDAIAYYTAALALRPQNPGVYLNRGLALSRVGQVDAAIADYRQALVLAPNYRVVPLLLGDALLVRGDMPGAITAYRQAITFIPESIRAHSNLGIALKARGELDAAITAFREAARLDPQSAPVQNNLGLALRDKGDLVAASDAFCQAIALDPQFTEAHFNLGTSRWLRQDVDGAIAAFQEAIALDPRKTAVHNNLGLALRTRGETDAAIAACRQAITLDPQNADAHSNLGLALRDKGDLEAALVACRQATQIDAKSATAHVNLGVVLAAQGDLDGALATYRQALTLDPRNAGALNNLGNVLKSRGELNGALDAYRQALVIEPRHTEAHVNMGTVLLAKKETDAAIKACRQAIEIDPMFPEAHSTLGNALLAGGDTDAALASHRQAIALRPTLAEAHVNLGTALHAKGDLAGARAAFQKAIDLKPKLFEANLNLANILWLQKDADAAIAAYRKVLALDPKSATAHYNLGLVLHTRGDREEAIAAYRQAITLQPRYADAHINLGNILLEKKEVDAAIAAYRQAIAADPKSATAQHNLGNALQSRGDLSGAHAAYTQAIKLNPKSALSHAGLAQVLAARGDWQQAIAIHRRAVELQPDLAAGRIQLVFGLHQQGKLTEAMAEYREVIRLQPTSAAAHNNLAWLLANHPDVKQRLPAEAVPLAQKAVELEPRNGPFWNTLAQAHYRTGNWKAAITASTKSIELTNGGECQDWLFLAMAHAQLNQAEEARKWYTRAVEWMEKTKSTDEDLRRFRAEAAELLKTDDPPK